ncbi:altered inheritance of mitochondria protein 3-like [Zingiber officinale]|uniref:DUF1421 domain-containing protein n=1 Tax=Zingiber officinale TaxID=94328 RepID=A0A8J5GFY5_ZINOF|nr:altered inheritance of mitochondria protein 3-like [Zingiber officinale]KAG6505085.1 hypothetical protein ZIOFF_037433 [Zingiber officinale]
MASGGSSGRPAASGSRSFDFGSDDILCSYDDFAAQDTSIGKRSDPPGKDLHENSMGRPLLSIYEQDEYSREGVLSSVEKCMKKYADNILRSLDGVSGRLSQLEIVCYKLERSVSELRADFIHDQSEKDVKFKSLEKHLQEVHRSVQILRDKQELVETQKELAKLQLVQKESTEKNENANARAASEPKSQNDKPDTGNQQLALTLPRQTVPTVLPAGNSQPVQQYKELAIPQQAPVPPNVQQDQIMTSQAANYYGQHLTVLQDQRSQPVQPEQQYMQPRSQLQDRPIQAPPQLPVNQNQPPSFPQYFQQLPPQTDQQLPQQTAAQAQIRPPPPSYTPYPSQPVNPAPEMFPSSMPMQAPNPAIPQPGGIRPEAFAYGYGGTGNSVSQPSPPLHHGMQQSMQPPVSQSSFGPQLGKGGGYMGNAPYPLPSHNIQGYNTAYSYPPSNLPSARNQYDSQFIRNHPYGEMIEKAISMGFDKIQVVSVVQRMSDSGQPMDFNALLDRLNGQSGGISARAW